MKQVLIYISIITLLYSCASQGKISGGPVDKTPPKVLVDKSTPNEQINFEKQDIELQFDEFIVVKNALKEMVISPPLSFLPKLDYRGKNATFKFNEKEILKEDATYSINFGKAIVDFREANPLENFTFVFSTGDYIDSLSISGKVLNGKDNKPVSDMLVMLYSDLRDSIPYLEKPFYSTRTDKEGTFKINNIKEDTFKIFALKDENVNYLYDLDNEIIAYQSDFLVLTDSANYNKIELLAFQEDPVLRVVEVNDKQKGRLSILFNQPIVNIDYSWSGSQDLIKVISQDTLLFFYDTIQTLAGDTLIIEQDTFYIKAPRSTSKVQSFSILQTSPRLPAAISPSEKIIFNSGTPILSVQNDSISVKDTSGLSIAFILDTLAYRSLSLSIKPIDLSIPLTLTILPNAIRDIYKQSNRDTLIYKINYLKKDETGVVIANVNPLLKDSFEYIIEFRKKTEVIDKHNTIELKDSLLTYTYMTPGEYSMHIIQDRNGNGKQDSGSYLGKQGPEPEKEFKFQPLKADWTIEERIDWNVKPEVKTTPKPGLDTDEKDKPNKNSPPKGREGRKK